MAAPPRRSRYAARREARRARARARERSHVEVELSAETRALDPMAASYTSSGKAAAWIALAAVGALALHGGVVGGGLWLGGGDPGQLEDRKIDVEVLDPPPLKQEPPKPPPPPEVEAAPPPPPRKAATRPADPPPPAPEPAKEAPRRVVGLNLDSTSQGGSGPAFAAGSTTEGKTETIAADPAEIPKEAPPPAIENKVATRIPRAGAKYVLPKRLKPAELPYPATLKAQGIEADVTVMVSIDATGKVTKVKIVRPAPYPEFNTIAERAAAGETFEPAMRDGAAIPYTLSFTYRFRLEER